LIAHANLAGKPVITATQMLESMISSRLPTRAEATDVANAILDGTDCIMLSGESAMGKFPIEAVDMLAKIASTAELGRSRNHLSNMQGMLMRSQTGSDAEAIASVVGYALNTVPCAALFVPTRSGNTARMISGFKPRVWIVAITHNQEIGKGLIFSYGIQPIKVNQSPENWRDFAKNWIHEQHIPANMALLVAGPSKHHPENNLRLEFMQVGD
jgi:pyruvate kinase